jgi:hypothetical protein
MAQTWGKPSPSPYSILYDQPQGLHPNVIFPRTPKLKVLKFNILEAHNFFCKPSIEMMFEKKL